jgi:uncharacterized delta-60 repeat protein
MNAFAFYLVRALALLLTLGLAACPGSGSDAPAEEEDPVDPVAPATYTVGGTVSGLTAPALRVTLAADFDGDGALNFETLEVTGNGPFTFSSVLPDGTTYSAAVSLTLDQSQVCGFSSPREINAGGPIDSANVTDLEIVCVPAYTVTGTINDLKGSGLTLNLTTLRFTQTSQPTSGSFSLGPLISGESYEITVPTQPSNPTQKCVVINGSGIIDGADVTDVEVNCGDATVSGVVTGLAGSGMIIALSTEVEVNGTSSMLVVEKDEIAADGPFEFDTVLNNGEPYRVTVWQQPTDPAQECVVNNDEGVISGDVTDVEVICPQGLRSYRFDTSKTKQFINGQPLKAGELATGFTLDDDVLYGDQAGPLGPISGLDDEELFKLYLDVPVPGGLSTSEAIGLVHSNKSGFNYWLAAESPGVDARIGDHFSHWAQLKTTWRYKKESQSAKFQLVISKVYALIFFDIASIHSDVSMFAYADLAVRAYPVAGSTASIDPFYNIQGAIELRGDLDSASGVVTWSGLGTAAELDILATTELELWQSTDFTVDLVGVGLLRPFVALMTLKAPITVDVDLSGVAVGEEILVVSSALVRANNTVSPEGSSAVFLRDPGEFDPDEPDGGVTVVDTTGLRMVDLGGVDLSDLKEGGGATPGVCDPSAERSVLQFEMTDYRLSEADDLPPYAAVRITRSGTVDGLVTARVTLTGGSAVAGEDFDDQELSVRFGDGSAAPRTLVLPIIDDDVMESDEDLTVLLADPEGCADIGAQSTAQVTILDDDVPAGPPSYTLGGTVTGLLGSGLILTNLSTNDLEIMADGTFAFAQNFGSGSRYEVRVAAQPTGPGQFCSVSNGSGIIVDSDVTDIEVTCEALSPGDGQLDAGFGTDGKVTIGVPGGATDMAVQPDGKILVVGNNTLARYTADGVLDSSFGTGGIVTVEFYEASYDRLQAVAVQADGQIVVAGYSKDGVNSPVQEDFVVARYDASGNLDLSFGTAGKAVTDFEARGDVAYDLLIQPDGAMVVTGSASIIDQFGVAGSDFAAIRYTSLGTLDAGFGVDGKANTEVAGRTDLGYAAAMQPDGKIVLAGRVANAGGDDPDIGLVRYNADGSLDTSFGAGGVLRDVTVEWDEAADVVVQPDGRLVVVGHAVIGGASMMTIARYNSDGSPDSTFGANGRVTDPMMDVGRGVALQPDGSIVVVGRRSGDFAIARFDSLGGPDMNFGTDGVIDVDFFGGIDEATAVVIQPDGKILAAGTSANGTTTGLGLVRVRGQ